MESFRQLYQLRRLSFTLSRLTNTVKDGCLLELKIEIAMKDRRNKDANIQKQESIENQEQRNGQSEIVEKILTDH